MAKNGTAGRTVQAPNEQTIKKLLAKCRGAAKDVAEINGSVRSEIGDAVDNKHLHKKAFSTLRMLDKMEPERLLEYWTHLELYMDLAGLKERMEKVARLEMGDKTDAEAAKEGAVGGKPANVTDLDKARAGQKEAATA